MSPTKREQFEKELVTKDRQDRRIWMTLRALNFLKQGGTKKEAWYQCSKDQV